MSNQLKFVIAAAAVILSSLSACALRSYLPNSDGHVEEIAETILEEILENALELDDDALKDKIDLTPWDDEAQKVLVMEKLMADDNWDD